MSDFATSALHFVRFLHYISCAFQVRILDYQSSGPKAVTLDADPPGIRKMMSSCSVVATPVGDSSYRANHLGGDRLGRIRLQRDRRLKPPVDSRPYKFGESPAARAPVNSGYATPNQARNSRLLIQLYRLAGRRIARCAAWARSACNFAAGLVVLPTYPILSDGRRDSTCRLANAGIPAAT